MDALGCRHGAVHARGDRWLARDLLHPHVGRAVDLSYRPSASKKLANRKDALEAIEKLCANANDLGIEMIIDYFPQPFGRAWKCDRQAWSKYSKPTVTGAPGGDWFHIEITPQAADSAIFVKAAFLKAFGEIHPY